jgi:RNA polymerase sigma-70 factor (ECF subfamily)
MCVDRRLRFESFYEEHGPDVKAYVLRRSDASSADDVVADVFLVCWRRFDEVPREPLPWLLGVARRVLSTQRRGEGRREALRERLVNEPGVSSAAIAPRDSALRAALGRLGESDRELLLLIGWDGLSPAEAAIVLEIKPSTARVRVLRARRRLASALAAAEMTSSPCTSISVEAQ